MGKESAKHSGKKKKKKHHHKKSKNSPDAVEAKPVASDEDRMPSTLLREDWMTKPKEGWLSVGKKPVRPETKAPAETGETKHEAGLYVPGGSQGQMVSTKSTVGDGGASWRLRALKRMKERSQSEDKSLSVLAAEHGMDLDRLFEESAKPSAHHRRPSHRPPRRSYLDDVQSEGTRMKKPRADRSAFTRRKRERTPEKERDDLKETASSAVALTRFADDGSFFEMFSEASKTGLIPMHPCALPRFVATGSAPTHGGSQRQMVETDQPRSAPDNASAADVLRQQLAAGTTSGTRLASSKGRDTVVLPLIGPDGRAAPGVFGREGQSTTHRRDKEPDTVTLYKRSRHGDDALDMDAALAKNISRQRRFDVRNDLDADMEYDFDVGTDLFQKKNRKNRNLTLSDLKHRERSKQVRAEQRYQALEDRCFYCFDGKRIPKHLVVSIATTAYVRLPEKGALDEKHCYIVPLEHLPSTREVDENVWTEIRNFKKALIQMHNAQGRDLIFLETAMHLADHGMHAFVECIPVDHEVFQKAPIYYKKAIDDATSDWSQHHAKRCIETGAKGLRGSIPPHFPYFHVEFNITNGFVHVIDDEAKFDPELGRRVLIGLLNRPAEDMYKRSDYESHEEQKRSVGRFLKDWYPYDWTVNL